MSLVPERSYLHLTIFDEILKKYKDNVNVIYAKSRSKAALKNYPEALELLKQAVSRNPKIIRSWAKEEPIFTVLHNNLRALWKGR